jgi:SAM-dependent methyltransferase
MTSDRPNELASNATFEFEALSHANNYRRVLLEEFASLLRGRVLEIGSGVGQFTASLRSAPGVTSLLAVEPDGAFCRSLRERMPDLDLVEGIASSLPDTAGGDAILCINVLEHIEDDLAELRTFHRLLRERRGALCLFVPARQEIYAPLDKDFGHFRRYSKPDLKTKLEQAGFAIERLEYFNFIGYFAWWLMFRVLGQRKFKAGSVRLFDQVIFPPMSWCERNLSRPPFGQSLLVTARAR